MQTYQELLGYIRSGDLKQAIQCKRNATITKKEELEVLFKALIFVIEDAPTTDTINIVDQMMTSLLVDFLLNEISKSSAQHALAKSGWMFKPEGPQRLLLIYRNIITNLLNERQFNIVIDIMVNLYYLNQFIFYHGFARNKEKYAKYFGFILGYILDDSKPENKIRLLVLKNVRYACDLESAVKLVELYNIDQYNLAKSEFKNLFFDSRLFQGSYSYSSSYEETTTSDDESTTSPNDEALHIHGIGSYLLPCFQSGSRSSSSQEKESPVTPSVSKKVVIHQIYSLDDNNVDEDKSIQLPPLKDDTEEPVITIEHALLDNPTSRKISRLK